MKLFCHVTFVVYSIRIFNHFPSKLALTRIPLHILTVLAFNNTQNARLMCCILYNQQCLTNQTMNH